jgi:hypothetical protein
MDELKAPDVDLRSQWVETTYRSIREINGRVVVAFCHTPDRVFDFSPKQWTLLHHLSSAPSLEIACEKADMKLATAQKFLRSREYRDFASAAFEIESVVRGFPAIRVLYETIRQFKGEIKLDDNQNKALDRLERLLMPKKQDGGINAGTVNVQVNNFPNLPPDMVEKLKALGDARASEKDAA